MKKRSILRLRDIVFVAVLCGALCIPAGLYVATEKFSFKVPSWLTMTEARYLQGYWDNVNVKQHVSLEGFASKELQDFF